MCRVHKPAAQSITPDFSRLALLGDNIAQELLKLKEDLRRLTARILKRKKSFLTISLNYYTTHLFTERGPQRQWSGTTTPVPRPPPQPTVCKTTHLFNNWPRKPLLDTNGGLPCLSYSDSGAAQTPEADQHSAQAVISTKSLPAASPNDLVANHPVSSESQKHRKSNK